MDGNGSRKIFINESFLASMVVLLALAVRVLHVIFTSKLNPLAGDLVLDAAGYDQWAKSIVWGGPPPPTTLMQAPLFPWFLSIVYRIFGPSLTAARAVQAVLGTAACGLMTVYTRRFFRSSSAGIAAGFIAAVYLPSIFYEGVLVPATLALFLGSVFLFTMAPETGAPSLARLLSGGFVLGLSVLAKPVALLLFPFALVHILIRSRRYDAKGAGRAVMMFCLGLVISLAPLTIRNARMTGEFIPLTTGGGINFYIGNNPGANGFYSVPLLEGRPIGGSPGEQDARMKSIAEEEEGRQLSPSEVSGFWLKKGFEYDLADPGRWASMLWKKTLYFWNAYERANVENMSFHRRFGGILGLPLLTFALAAPLGLLGIFMSRDRWKRLWPLYGGVAAYFISALIFYVLARYRLPMLAFLIPFAGAAAAGILKLIMKKKWVESSLMILALAVLWFFVNTPVAKDTPAGLASSLLRTGRIYEMRGDKGKAAEAYTRALEADPASEAARQGLERTGGR